MVTMYSKMYSKWRELVQQFKSGTITIEQFLEIVLTSISQKSGTSTQTIITITTTKTTPKQTFQGIRKDVSADELLQSKVIDEKIYKDLTSGKVTVDHASEMDSERKYLKGTNSIAGVFVQSTKQTLSISDAKNKGLLTPGTSLVLLEAQAATGFMIDTVKNKKLSVEQGGGWRNCWDRMEKQSAFYRTGSHWLHRPQHREHNLLVPGLEKRSDRQGPWYSSVRSSDRHWRNQ